MFIARPGETLPILSRLFKMIYDDSQPFQRDPDLVERANFYYNLLKESPNKLKNIFKKKTLFIEEQDKEKKFDQEFNLYGMNDLRIVYRKQENYFV